MAMVDLDEKLRLGIKSALDRIGWTMRDLSDATDIPYRTLQNYLAGANKMPASVLVNICDMLRIDVSYLIHGSFESEHWPMFDALWDVFGDNLLNLEVGEDIIGLEDMESHNAKRLKANEFAKLIGSAYGKYRDINFRQLKELKPPIEDQKSKGPQHR